MLCFVIINTVIFQPFMCLDLNQDYVEFSGIWIDVSQYSTHSTRTHNCRDVPTDCILKSADWFRRIGYLQQVLLQTGYVWLKLRENRSDLDMFIISNKDFTFVVNLRLDFIMCVTDAFLKVIKEFNDLVDLIPLLTFI